MYGYVREDDPLFATPRSIDLLKSCSKIDLDWEMVMITKVEPLMSIVFLHLVDEPLLINPTTPFEGYVPQETYMILWLHKEVMIGD